MTSCNCTRLKSWRTPNWKRVDCKEQYGGGEQQAALHSAHGCGTGSERRRVRFDVDFYYRYRLELQEEVARLSARGPEP